MNFESWKISLIYAEVTLVLLGWVETEVGIYLLHPNQHFGGESSSGVWRGKVPSYSKVPLQMEC